MTVINAKQNPADTVASVRGTYNSTFNGYDTERDYGCMPPEQHGGLLQVSFTNIKIFFFCNEV